MENLEVGGLAEVAKPFGGDWTLQKLEALNKYLGPFTRIFAKNPAASYYSTMYIDGFAGTGAFVPKTLSDREARWLIDGSARLALKVEFPFNRYVFIDKDRRKLLELERYVREETSLLSRTCFLPGDANVEISRVLARTDWERTRAVAFLDPFGMQVNWRTLEAIGATRAIDLWLLFPIGVGVQRNLARDTPPSDQMKGRFLEFLGCEMPTEWYKPAAQQGLFDATERFQKTVTWPTIAELVLARLATAFARVCPWHLVLRNSTNAPLYLLLFAAANPDTPGETAIRIATSVMRSMGDAARSTSQ